jgi:hypothetical protein
MFMNNPDPEYQVKQEQLKPSQAMRIGIALSKPGIGLFTGGGGACALGAILIGLGAKPFSVSYTDLYRIYPELEELEGGIIKRNDSWRWSRGRIANWLEKKGL